MSGLVCSVCGTPWKLDKPLLYHHDKLHCDSHACSRECAECHDWEHAIEGEAASPTNTPGPEAHGKVATAAAPSFSKAPGYAEMMAKLKGGESKA
jgi:hypothetical protein